MFVELHYVVCRVLLCFVCCVWVCCVLRVVAVVCCVSCVLCCAWGVVPCLLIGVGLDFSKKFCSNVLCFWLCRGHNFLYCLAQNRASERLGAPRSHPGPPFGGAVLRSGPSMSIFGGLRRHSGILRKASGHPGTPLEHFFEARGRHFYVKRRRKCVFVDF